MTRPKTPRPAPITWQTALCEATRTGWHFQLPVTVSTNRLWRHGKNRTYKSAEARQDAQAAALKFGRCAPLDGDVAVRVTWVRATRAGDVDNRIKATLDLLRGVAYGDDKQIARLTVERADTPSTPAGLYVWVEPIALLQEVYQAADLNNGDNGFNASWTYAELYHKEWARANSAEHRAERMARVVEALREPSAAVLNAAFVNLYPGCFVEERTEHLTPEIRYAIRAAVAAAERETSTETSHD